MTPKKSQPESPAIKPAPTWVAVLATVAWMGVAAIILLVGAM